MQAVEEEKLGGPAVDTGRSIEVRGDLAGFSPSEPSNLLQKSFTLTVTLQSGTVGKK